MAMKIKKANNRSVKKSKLKKNLGNWLGDPIVARGKNNFLVYKSKNLFNDRYHYNVIHQVSPSSGFRYGSYDSLSEAKKSMNEEAKFKNK